MENQREIQKVRGSDKLRAAWEKRALKDDEVHEIAAHLDKSVAKVEAVRVIGGVRATGVEVALSYTGEDVPRCGNDVAFWLHWLRNHGGNGRPPRIIINGTPFPEELRLELLFGDVDAPRDLGRDLQQLEQLQVRGG